MAMLKSWMFLPMIRTGPESAVIRNEPPRVEEIRKRKRRDGSLAPKEIFLVVIFWFVLTGASVTLVLYLWLRINGHSAADDVLKVFQSLSAALFGYFVGVNKERG